MEGCVAGAKVPPCLSSGLIVSSSFVYKGANKKLVILPSQCGNLIRSHQREGGGAGMRGGRDESCAGSRVEGARLPGHILST